MSNIPTDYSGRVNLRPLPSLAWPSEIATGKDAMLQIKGHRVIDEVTDAFDQFGPAIAAMDNIEAPGRAAGKPVEPSTTPQQRDYSPAKGDVVLVKQYVGDAGKRPDVAELNFDPESGAVKRFAVMMDEKNQYICEGANSNNPTFIRIEDGRKSSVTFNTEYKQISGYYYEA